MTGRGRHIGKRLGAVQGRQARLGHSRGIFPWIVRFRPTCAPIAGAHNGPAAVSLPEALLFMAFGRRRRLAKRRGRGNAMNAVDELLSALGPDLVKLGADIPSRNSMDA